MRWLSDDALDHLRQVAELPDLTGSRYEVLEVLGRGGMGTVYRARDPELERDVALKVLSIPDEGSRLASRLRQEARILARLEHPGIVPIHDVGTLADGRVFYTMKRVEGRRLDEVVQRGASLAERLRIFERLCEAVAFAHSRGVLHRDLKPENVMVGSFGEVLVMDWGLAKVSTVSERDGLEQEAAAKAPGAQTRPTPEPPAHLPRQPPAETAHGTVLGTPGYMAPEQARGDLEALGPATDVYALGALLSFLLSGRPPSQAAGNDAGTHLSDLDGQPLPPPLASVVRRALEPHPQERYADAVEIGREVSRFLQGLPVEAHPEGLFERLQRLASKYRLPLVLILAYLAMRVLLLLLLGR